MQILNVGVFKSLILNDIAGVESLYELIPDQELKDRLKRLNDREKATSTRRNQLPTAKLVLPDPQMKKNPHTGIIRNDNERVKVLKNTLSKRRLRPDLNWISYPLGYRGPV